MATETPTQRKTGATEDVATLQLWASWWHTAHALDTDRAERCRRLDDLRQERIDAILGYTAPPPKMPNKNRMSAEQTRKVARQNAEAARRTRQQSMRSSGSYFHASLDKAMHQAMKGPAK